MQVKQRHATRQAGLHLSLYHLSSAAEHIVPADDMERLVVVMSGQCQITVDGYQWLAVGRRHTVFFGAPYVAYIPLGCRLHIWNEGRPCELAVVSTRAFQQLEPWLATADHIVAALSSESTSRESAASRGIVLAQAGVNTDRLDMGERMVSPGTGVSIPIQMSRATNSKDGSQATCHIVHYRLYPTNSHAYQWAISADDSHEETWTVYDGDLKVLPSGKCAAIAPPGTYVYYLWAAAVKRAQSQLE